MRISGSSSSRRTGLASAKFRGRVFCLTFRTLHRPSRLSKSLRPVSAKLLSARPRPAGCVSKPDEWERMRRSRGMYDTGMRCRTGSLDACFLQGALVLRSALSVAMCRSRALPSVFAERGLRSEAPPSLWASRFWCPWPRYSPTRGPEFRLPEALSSTCVEVCPDTVRDPASQTPEVYLRGGALCPLAPSPFRGERQPQSSLITVKRARRLA